MLRAFHPAVADEVDLLQRSLSRRGGACPQSLQDESCQVAKTSTRLVLQVPWTSSRSVLPVAWTSTRPVGSLGSGDLHTADDQDRFTGGATADPLWPPAGSAYATALEDTDDPVQQGISGQPGGAIVNQGSSGQPGGAIVQQASSSRTGENHSPTGELRALTSAMDQAIVLYLLQSPHLSHASGYCTIPAPEPSPQPCIRLLYYTCSRALTSAIDQAIVLYLLQSPHLSH
ncbi:unnamed protein product [Boreogadus saida]